MTMAETRLLASLAMSTRNCHSKTGSFFTISTATRSLSKDKGRFSCADDAGRLRLNGRGRPLKPLFVDELDRLFERRGRDPEQASIGHAEFEDEENRKRDRQRAESQGCGDQGVAWGV